MRTFVELWSCINIVLSIYLLVVLALEDAVYFENSIILKALKKLWSKMNTFQRFLIGGGLSIWFFPFLVVGGICYGLFKLHKCMHLKMIEFVEEEHED